LLSTGNAKERDFDLALQPIHVGTGVEEVLRADVTVVSLRSDGAEATATKRGETSPRDGLMKSSKECACRRCSSALRNHEGVFTFDLSQDGRE
jgi:hypothetical protein